MSSEKQPEFDISTPEGQRALRNIIITAQGGNPEAQQTLNEFMRFDDSIERTNLPKRKDVQRAIFFSFVGQTLYPDTKDDPFTVAAECIAKGFMAKGGEKSKQFVDMFRSTPNLTDLQNLQGPTERSFTDRLFGRNQE